VAGASSRSAEIVIVILQCAGSTSAGWVNDTARPAGGEASTDGRCEVKMSMTVWLDSPASTGLAWMMAAAGVAAATIIATAMSESRPRRRVFTVTT
jgi:hypothetical protein